MFKIGVRRIATAVIIALSVGLGAALVRAQSSNEDIDEINSEFHFLNAADTLLLHEEDGVLKGQINIAQSEEESDAVLSYLLNGTRKKNHVEFKTRTIHGKYFRFSGAIERGTGHEARDPDFLRLEGDLEIITLKEETGKEITDRRRVIFKSLGEDEMDQ